MRTTVWRPSTALRKRRTQYLSLLDATGVAAIFVFFVGMYMVMWSPSHDLSHDSVDLAATNHPKMQPAPIKEDAITETLTSDGRLRFGNTRVPPGDFRDFFAAHTSTVRSGRFIWKRTHALSTAMSRLPSI